MPFGKHGFYHKKDGSETLEKEFTKPLRDLLTHYQIETEKINGNRYQCGLPDLLCTRPDGKQIWIEMKRGRSMKWHYQALAALDGRQKYICVSWAKKGVTVWVVLGYEDGTYAIVNPRFDNLEAKIEHITLLNVAERIIHVD